MPSTPTPQLSFHNESGKEIPISVEDLRAFVQHLEREESCSFQMIEVVMVDEDEIVRLNREHLDRDYVTDIITFRYDEDYSNNSIEGTLFICAQRVYEQCKEFDETADNEFRRVLVHGLLHLCGYEDESDEQQKRMTDKEDYYLAKISDL